MIHYELSIMFGLSHLSGYTGVYGRNTSGHIEGLECTSSMCNGARSIQSIEHDSTCLITTKILFDDDRPRLTRVVQNTLCDTSGYDQFDLDWLV